MQAGRFLLGIFLSAQCFLVGRWTPCSANAAPILPAQSDKTTIPKIGDGALKGSKYSDAELLDEVQERAVRFFLEKTDAVTGLTQDRAKLDGSDEYVVASIAATGYGLAALPIAVEHGWLSRSEGQARAIRYLKFLHAMPQQHGFFFHFVNKKSGERTWDSEVSSIDTGLLICGALVCGQYFGGEALQRAKELYDRTDWKWMLTEDGTKPEKRLLCLGWKPETGFLPYSYGFCEATLIYLLAIGSRTAPIPADCWVAMGHPVIGYKGRETLLGGPIFIQQMPQNFFPLRGRRDDLGFDYWVSATNSILIQRAYCMDKMGERASYGPNFWGLNAGDSPDGYEAFGAPGGPENGTLSPTGVLASLPFAPKLSLQAAQAMQRTYKDRIWGHYGFCNAYNVDRNWFAPDVIGIDLGMALLAIENYRSGLPWKLMEAQPSTTRAYKAIGLRRTTEPEPRAFRVQAH